MADVDGGNWVQIEDRLDAVATAERAAIDRCVMEARDLVKVVGDDTCGSRTIALLAERMAALK